MIGRALRSLFAFDQPLGRAPFALAAVALMVMRLGVRYGLSGHAHTAPLQFYPQILYEVSRAWLPVLIGDGPLMLWLAFDLLTSWLIVMLALRRAADADAGSRQFLAVLAIIPLLQLPVIAYLSLLPMRRASEAALAPAGSRVLPAWADAARAALIGGLVTVAIVATGGLVLGSYQNAMFVLTPFFIGVVAGYLVNRRGDRGMAATTRVVALSTVVGAAALLSLALEGFICVIVIAPLAFVVAWLGGITGRFAARSASWGRLNLGGALAVILVALGLEAMAQREAAFELRSTIDIDAPASAVWSALVEMETIAEEPGLPFRLGVAYPVRGTMVGTGIGATRHGEFSTGIAVERITVWQPPVELAYRVLSEPPSMRELSFYDEVHAPHVHGYFSTGGGRFSLVELDAARTRLVVNTWHAMRLEPSAYWLPFARWVVSQNHQRVLRHVRRNAEARQRRPQRLPITISSGALTK